MTSTSSDPGDRVLSSKAIWWSAVVLLAVAAGAAAWLLLAYGHSDAPADQVSNQLAAIRTAGTIVVGTGGGAALLLAARRQRTAERDHARQVNVDADTRLDATERRITELYTKAAEQLGSDKAPVRLAGLYALERLAQNNPTQRQTIVNVLCAYLRMPYQPPAEPDADTDETAFAAYQERVQEREVRLTAQRLLTDHLQPGDSSMPAQTFWADTHLDLTGAVLIDFSLARCVVDTATFRAAKFFGRGTFFGAANFTRMAEFGAATFDSPTFFGNATFAGTANFWMVAFGGDVNFGEATFASTAVFRGSHFKRNASFESVTFARDPLFELTKFDQRVPDEVARYWTPPAP